MTRVFWCRIFWLALMLGVEPARAADASRGPAGGKPAPTQALRRWSHPAQEYSRTVRRWFVNLPPDLPYSEVRRQTGDDARWAEPMWDDTDWAIAGFWDLRARSGVEWVRFRVRMGDDGQDALPGGIMISTVRAYEIFWDGVKIGNSGVPGMSRETEEVGRVDE